MHPLPNGTRDGATVTAADTPRLNEQARRVYDLMADRQWRTLAQIAEATGDPEASVSARLRDLRKVRFGGHTVERRKASAGLHEYRLNPAGRASGGELYCYLCGRVVARPLPGRFKAASDDHIDRFHPAGATT